MNLGTGTDDAVYEDDIPTAPPLYQSQRPQAVVDQRQQLEEITFEQALGKTSRCPWCGNFHPLIFCPWITEIHIHQNGGLKSVKLADREDTKQNFVFASAAEMTEAETEPETEPEEPTNGGAEEPTNGA